MAYEVDFNDVATIGLEAGATVRVPCRVGLAHNTTMPNRALVEMAILPVGEDPPSSRRRGEVHAPTPLSADRETFNHGRTIRTYSPEHLRDVFRRERENCLA